MRKINQLDNAVIDLAAESFNNVTPYSVEAALARGIIVEVTDWVVPDIGFGKRCFRPRVVLTARLWDALLQAYVRRKNASYEDACSRRNDVLWLAAQALERAGNVGSDAANFTMDLPTDDRREEPHKTLRVECFDRQDRRCSHVTIGFPEDFAGL